MPDWDIELTLTLGKGRVLTRMVTIEDVPQQGVAQVAGIEECLNWAKEPDSPVPVAAYDYWQKAKREGAMPYEVLTELENNWHLTFTCKEHVETPVVATQPAPRSNVRTTPSVSNDRGANPSLLVTLRQRYLEVNQLIGELQEEQKILERLFGKPKRKYERKAKQSRSRRSPLRQSKGGRNSTKGVSGVQKNNRRVRHAVSGPDIRHRSKPVHERDGEAAGTHVELPDGIAETVSAAISFDAGERN